MGWCDESGEHEGYVALVFADGEQSTTTSGQGAHVWPGGTAGKVGDITREEVRPYSDVVAWQVQCECGWSGRTYRLVDEDPSNILPRWMEPIEERESQIIDEWRAHVRPANAVYRLARLADDAREVDAQIEESVSDARRAGASWSQIGRELGMTKQGAQQRYGA